MLDDREEFSHGLNWSYIVPLSMAIIFGTQRVRPNAATEQSDYRLSYFPEYPPCVESSISSALQLCCVELRSKARICGQISLEIAAMSNIILLVCLYGNRSTDKRVRITVAT